MKTFKDYLISQEQQRILKQEYLDSNYALINSKRPVEDPDSLYYTYDLDVLMSYLEYAKQMANQQGIADLKVRINMGKYPTSGFDSRLRAEYQTHQTIYITTLSRNSEGVEQDISGVDAMDFNTICPPPYPI
ncbi:MAG: hypothetical protein JST62_09355 [Bacteroidetes bacterium]|jgi:hypothetical protein|nr:hypothetical protein [Bacteroidota bacterium]